MNPLRVLLGSARPVPRVPAGAGAGAALALTFDLAASDPLRPAGESCRYCDAEPAFLGGTVPHDPSCLWLAACEVAETADR